MFRMQWNGITIGWAYLPDVDFCMMNLSMYAVDSSVSLNLQRTSTGVLNLHHSERAVKTITQYKRTITSAH